MAVTVGDAITYARQKALTDSNGISDTKGLAWSNAAVVDVTRELIVRGVDAAGIQESYATLSSADAVPGRFAWPSDMWMLKTIEVDYSGAGGGAYIQAAKLDVANLQFGTSWDYLRLNQSVQAPQFTNHGDTGEIFPTPTSSALIRIFYYLKPTDATATTDLLTYPMTLDWRVIGDKIVEAYYQSLQRLDESTAWGQIAMKKIVDSINILAPQSKQPIQAEKLHMTGWNF